MSKFIKVMRWDSNDSLSRGNEGCEIYLNIERIDTFEEAIINSSSFYGFNFGCFFDKNQIRQVRAIKIKSFNKDVFYSPLTLAEFGRISNKDDISIESRFEILDL